MFLFYVNPILIAAAVIPAIVLLRFVYKEDRLDKESPGLLLSLVIFGILSTFAAIVTEQIGEAILGISCRRVRPPTTCCSTSLWSRCRKRALSTCCSRSARGIQANSTASSTAWSTPCSSRSALPCGRISAMC